MKEYQKLYHRIDDYGKYLNKEEKSRATVKKYLSDLNDFFNYAKADRLTKETVLKYKELLREGYAPASANSKIAALNSFFRFCGREELCVKQIKIQKKAYVPEEKELSREEYARLVQTAEKNKNERLSLVIQTICGTGIRVSELAFLTVDAVHKGETTVSCKGKTRSVFIVSTLRKKLLRYIKEKRISSGVIFTTKNGRPLDRSNIWREMKELCAKAKVDPRKVFPHNLRHLFARTFYGIEKDIAKLADILGHSSINTTRIYIATTGAEHRRRMENMRLII